MLLQTHQKKGVNLKFFFDNLVESNKENFQSWGQKRTLPNLKIIKFKYSAKATKDRKKYPTLIPSY